MGVGGRRGQPSAESQTAVRPGWARHDRLEVVSNRPTGTLGRCCRPLGAATGSYCQPSGEQPGRLLVTTRQLQARPGRLASHRSPREQQ